MYALWRRPFLNKLENNYTNNNELLYQCFVESSLLLGRDSWFRKYDYWLKNMTNVFYLSNKMYSLFYKRFEYLAIGFTIIVTFKIYIVL